MRMEITILVVFHVNQTANPCIPVSRCIGVLACLTNLGIHLLAGLYAHR